MPGEYKIVHFTLDVLKLLDQEDSFKGKDINLNAFV